MLGSQSRFRSKAATGASSPYYGDAIPKVETVRDLANHVSRLLGGPCLICRGVKLELFV